MTTSLHSSAVLLPISSGFPLLTLPFYLFLRPWKWVNNKGRFWSELPQVLFYTFIYLYKKFTTRAL